MNEAALNSSALNSSAALAIITLVAALAYGALALAVLVRRVSDPRAPYGTALLATAGWLCVLAMTNAGHPAAWLAEAMRNLAWLWFMASIAGRHQGARKIGAVGWIYIGLFAIEAVLAALFALGVAAGQAQASVGLARIHDTMQMLFSAGTLVLLHNLIEAGRPDERRALTLPLGAMAGLWTYELNLFAISYLSDHPATLLIDLRPVAALAMCMLLGVAALRPAGQAVRLSRPVAFRSLALAGVAAWLALLSMVAVLLSRSGGEFSVRAQIVVLAATVGAMLLLFLSPRLRAQVRVFTAKHFFEHRYDYRAEWLRFTATLNRPEDAGLSLDARVVKAVADIVESSGGALASHDNGGAFALSAAWPQGLAKVPGDADWSSLVDWMRTSERIVQLDEVRAGRAPVGEAAAVPAWMLADPALWIAVPLVHLGRVEGVILLVRPPLTRALDWEDFDLLKVAARQAASNLAEARGAEALAQSERFDEFHRRFAFMMHDVKNLASQMALLSRNAERHGDNPEFRQDMVATLRVSADRLAQLMQRLSSQEKLGQQEKMRIGRTGPVDLSFVANRVAGMNRGLYQIEVSGTAAMRARADIETLEQLLNHLVQNAIDASDGRAPVILRLGNDDAGQPTISVEDQGVGMSLEYIRSDLFRPFSSTKDGGFGIGAFQARQLAVAMGGTLSVESREGQGTRFTVSLLPADGDAAADTASASASTPTPTPSDQPSKAA